MGKEQSKLPPITERDTLKLLSYNIEEKHIMKLWHRFVKMDIDCNGVWTVSDLYQLIQEPRLSMRAPIIDALFFMGDSSSEGSLGFQDFIVTFTSFCSLTKEEMLQLLFIIVDRDRNGRIEKEELLDFFSYVPVGSGSERAPIFPVNNKNALDKFRGGKWGSLEFDGLAQLCERFPYISYPAYHVQELYRRKLLGMAFWDRLDQARITAHARRKRKARVPGTTHKVEVTLPGRCTMQEILEFSRKHTVVHLGRRVAAAEDDRTSGKVTEASRITRERDEMISRCPLLNMIRNPRCMYHVPLQTETVAKQFLAERPEMEDAGVNDEMVQGSPSKFNKEWISQRSSYSADAPNPLTREFGTSGDSESSASEYTDSGSGCSSPASNARSPSPSPSQLVSRESSTRHVESKAQGAVSRQSSGRNPMFRNSVVQQTSTMGMKLSVGQR